MNIREKIDDYFESNHVQKQVAYLLLKYGLKIIGNKIYCGPIEQSSSKLARVLNIDYRIITDTINHINADPELKQFFSAIEPTPNFKNTGKQYGWGVIEIIPENSHAPGICASVSTLIAQEKISIRQAISEDYELTEDPKFIIVTEAPIPDHLIAKIRQLPGVKAITLY